jgi:Peptide N-acetyl-beta-D-glucosaminyl asparaginase amidase A
MFLVSRLRQVVLLSSACIAAFVFSACPARSQDDSSRFQIGSSNTVTADPLVPRPHEKPCIVPLFSGYQFVNFNIQSYSFTPPDGCPGPWKKVVFTADFNVTAGRQFDRTAIVDLGYVNLYYGTTPEPRHNLSPTWHIERDLTDYSALFESAHTGDVILGNVVNSTYTGVITGSAALEFYPQRGESDRDASVRPADAVYPLTQSNSNGGVNEPAFLYTTTDQLATTFTLPRNIESAYLDVIAQSQIGDEFWYSCVPNDVANELQNCGGTAFREVEVSIDGQPAGVAPVYPWIYTGGIDPLLWEPIPGVQALNFVPYRVNLTPFAGILSDGQPHTIALSVFNANSYFAATATLLLYEDRHSNEVTGQVTENTLAAPNPTIKEDLQTDSSGDVSGTVTTTSDRNFEIAGFVITSHGRIDTEVRQAVNFSNLQNYTINGTTYTQDITQTTGVESKTVTRRGFNSSVAFQTFHYPLTLDYTLSFLPDGTVTQLANASQKFEQNLLTPFYASWVRDSVNSTDTLDLSSSFSITGNSGQKSDQHYTSFDTRGDKYDCSLAAQDSMLTSVSRGCTAPNILRP